MKSMIILSAAMIVSFSGPTPPDRQRNIDERFKAMPTQTIEIRGFSGSNITFRSWDSNEVRVRLNIRISTTSEKDEQRYLDGVALKKSESPQSLTISFEEPSFMSRSHYSFWSWLGSIFPGSATRKTIEGEVFIPRANALTAELRYGSVLLEGMNGPLTLRGTGNTVVLKHCSAVEEIANDFGNITVERSGGAMVLSTKSSTVTLDQFNGRATIDADYSNITVRDVKQSLAVQSKSATINVDGVGGDLRIRSDFSKISVADIGGMVEIDDQSGSIGARNIGGVNIRGLYSTMDISDVTGKGSKRISIIGQSGSIALQNATGATSIENPYGDVELRNLRGDVNVQSKSSRISGDRVWGDWTSETEYCTLTLRELTAERVIMSNTSGKIDLNIKSIPSLTDIRNEYADVNIEIPKGFSGDVDLDVTYGRIDSNVPHITKRVYRESGGYHLRFEGNGKTKLAVETKSGNVRVMER